MARWFQGALAALGVLGLLAMPAEARVGMTLAEFEAVSGRPIDNYDGPEGVKGRIYRDTWVSEASRKQFAGRTAIEVGNNQRVAKEVFLLDAPLSNDEKGAMDAVGIAFNLLPQDTPRKFVDSGRRSYEKGWVLWFDYGAGRYLNFFLDKEEKRIEAIVAGEQLAADGKPSTGLGGGGGGGSTEPSTDL